MRIRNEPPTRGSSCASAERVSPGHIQWRMLSGSIQAANTSSREAGISLRITSVSWLSGVACGMRFSRFGIKAEIAAGLLFAGQEVALQGIQADLPEVPVMLEPGRRLLQRFGFQRAMVLAAEHLPPHEPGPLEHHEVLRDRVQRHRKGFGDLADGGRPAGERRQNGPPRWIGDRGEDAVQGVGMICNHSVEYYGLSARLSRVLSVNLIAKARIKELSLS